MHNYLNKMLVSFLLEDVATLGRKCTIFLLFFECCQRRNFRSLCSVKRENSKWFNRNAKLKSGQDAVSSGCSFLRPKARAPCYGELGLFVALARCRINKVPRWKVGSLGTLTRPPHLAQRQYNFCMTAGLIFVFNCFVFPQETVVFFPAFWLFTVSGPKREAVWVIKMSTPNHI